MSPSTVADERNIVSGDPVSPLRIQKGTEYQAHVLELPPSPSHHNEADASEDREPAPPRPLSELRPMEHRRNSPSSTQPMESPEQQKPSPLSPTTKTAQTRALWQVRENTAGQKQHTPGRRSSVERLKRASRVQNNAKLFNAPGNGRPLSYHGGQTQVPRTNSPQLTRSRTDSPVNDAARQSRIPLPTHRLSDASDRAQTPPPRQLGSAMGSPIKHGSPIKSSLVNSSFNSPGSDGRASGTRTPTRRPKSVTFDKEVDQVLEYEMVTPEPSVGGSPGNGRYDSDETDEEDYDLENTPVIEPDAWSHMNEPLPPHGLGEPFRETPSPSGRPLPPLPGMSRTDSPNGGRPLPTLPLGRSHPRMSLQDRLDLLMHEGHDPNADREAWENARRNSAPERQRPQSMSVLDLHPDFHHNQGRDMRYPDEHDEDETDDDEESGSVVRYSGEGPDRGAPSPDPNHGQHNDETSEYEPPRLSRESIRRQVAQQSDDESDATETTEDHSQYQFDEHSQNGDADQVPAKQEPGKGGYGLDLNAIPELNPSGQRPISRFGERQPEEEELTESETSAYNAEDDMESTYSQSEQGSIYSNDRRNGKHDNSEDENSDATPVPGSPVIPNASSPKQQKDDPLNPASIPNLSPQLTENNFTGDLGLHEYMTPPAQTPTPTQQSLSTLQARADLEHAAAVEAEQKSIASSEDDDVGMESDTGSVIRHHIVRSEGEDQESEEYSEDDSEYEEGEEVDRDEDRTPVQQEPVEPPKRSPSPVAEDVATIRAPDGKLKTRASATPADMAAMAAARRIVSGQHMLPSDHVPQGYRSEGDLSESSDESSEDELEIQGVDDDRHSDSEQVVGRRVSGKLKRKISLLPALGEIEFGLDDLNDEFDRVIEKEKRGYLMRQNTRIIHASSVDPDEEEAAAGPNGTPAKPGHARGKSWSVEPWRTNNRRRSGRDSLTGRKRTSGGPVPPLPGQESVSQRLPSVAESDAGRSSIASAEADNVERGRLFVKVIGVKDLNLPIPQGQPQYFCLTLDNGLHCVTTSWLELGKNAPIGQEFELVVLNDLEFQLTLQTKLEPPPPQPKQTQKPTITKPKQSTVSKFFTSPKKRKQLELEHQQMLKEQQRKAAKANTPATAWELLHGLVARDGSFARAYVSLRDFESRAYGRPFTTDIACFNEWAVDTSSVKSKKGVQSSLQPARKAPYKIGKLEVQLFFVPKPKGAADTDLPKSMNAAIRELKEAEQIMSRTWEGILSQQGGDCPFWRRRYFKLNGVRLTAYHEQTRQPRATINLSKATRLIDDRRSLVDPSVAGPGNTRRKSGFSEEEEGYMFVEEGFRIRFGNGEVIDFYADSAEDKRGWMKILGETIGHVPDSRSWCQMVLAKEAKRKAEKERRESGAAKVKAAQTQQQQTAARLSAGVAPPPTPPGAGDTRPRRGSVAQTPVMPMSPKQAPRANTMSPTTGRRPLSFYKIG